jgi:hypothetical protein
MAGNALTAILLLGATLGVFSPTAAQAYLDPGTGSAVIQMVVAGVMGALFVVKMYWQKLRVFFGMAPAEDSDSAAQPANDERD